MCAAAYVRVRGRREAALPRSALVTMCGAQCVCAYVRVRGRREAALPRSALRLCACDSVRDSAAARYVRVR
jgi:hypothetical protein